MLTWDGMKTVIALQLGPGAVRVELTQAIDRLAFADPIGMQLSEQRRHGIVRNRWYSWGWPVKYCAPIEYSAAMFAIDAHISASDEG